MKLRDILWRTIKAFGQVVGVLALLFGLVAGWAWWDMHQLRAFCREVRPGVPVSRLPEIAEDHGIERRWVDRHGIADEKAGDWFLPVPAASTMGEVVCAIHHDKTVVRSAAIRGP
jgi:hypothetical protein